MDPEMQGRFQQWKDGMMENRQGDMANVFGLAEALARQSAARGTNINPQGILEQMLAGMGGPRQPVPASMNIPGGGVTPATWMREPTSGQDAGDLSAKLGYVGGAKYMGQDWL